MIKSNSAKAWLLAARPKTLTGAAVPVVVAIAMAWKELGFTRFMWLPAILCLLFAFLMQIDANFVNDYFDCVRGIDDEDRLGPERACQQGWITLPAMKQGIVLTTILSCLVGLPLVYWGGWTMIGVGIACVVFCFLYTTLLSRMGLGDVLVLVFFGLVPVGATYYLQTQEINIKVILMGMAIGVVTDCLLLVNNYRDRETDAKHQKHTLVTLIGAKATEWLYLACGLLGVVLATIAIGPYVYGCCTLYLVLHANAWDKTRSIKQGRALNAVLGRTALNIMLFGICVTAAILVS